MHSGALMCTMSLYDGNYSLFLFLDNFTNKITFMLKILQLAVEHAWWTKPEEIGALIADYKNASK